jgi:hypothetical protein
LADAVMLILNDKKLRQHLRDRLVGFSYDSGLDGYLELFG